ncbi:MAG: T9SS type A sorting domain-containing protein [Flavobacteriales bacterium]|nr:T9SS type A sorting domain-containing protein [Flavobacteriales bacterium]
MRILSLIILFAVTQMLPAQAQVSFPTSNAVWTNTQYAYVWNPPNPIPDLQLTDVDTYCVDGQDTTIQSNQYTAIYRCQYLYKGALREVNSAVYFVPADSTQEYLLYDFGAQTGQTLQNVYIGNHFDEEFMLQDFTVQQTATEIIGGISRRVVYVDSYRWIEGIGCETGLFMEPWSNVSNYENRLECFTLNSQMVFPTQSTDPCPYIFVGVNDTESSSVSIEIYPNPTNQEVTISLGSVQSNINVSITNILGEQVRNIVATNTDQIHLELKMISGIYHATVTLENGKRSSFRIVKN